jgi:hypothetical protein
VKLANIRGADPKRDGGLMNGSKLDGFFWDELGGHEAALVSRLRKFDADSGGR